MARGWSLPGRLYLQCRWDVFH